MVEESEESYSSRYMKVERHV